MTASLPPRCPVAYAHSALVLLQSGRAAMALRLLELLPEAIEAQLIQVRRVGFTDGWRSRDASAAQVEAVGTATGRPRASAARKPSRLAVLRAALADPAKRARLRTAMHMEDWLLDRIAAGTATLSGPQWRCVREALA